MKNTHNETNTQQKHDEKFVPVFADQLGQMKRVLLKTEELCAVLSDAIDGGDEWSLSLSQLAEIEVVVHDYAIILENSDVRSNLKNLLDEGVIPDTLAELTK